MKIKNLLLATAIASSTLYAGVDYQVSLGATNTKLGTLSQTGTTIKFIQGDEKGFSYILGLNFGDKFNTTEFSLAYNWEITPSIYLGLNGGVTGVALEGTSYSETSFTGFDYGAQAKYKIADHHFVDLVYKTGTVSDESGLLEIDISSTALLYSYKF